MSGGIYNGCMGAGQIIALLFGPPASAAIGFRSACDVIACVSMLFGLVYLCVGGGAKAFAESCRNCK